MTDDWMNPTTRREYTYQTPQYPRFLIMRKRRLDYFPFEEWSMWSSHETRDERDQKLMELRKQHPAWILKKTDELHAPIAYI